MFDYTYPIYAFHFIESCHDFYHFFQLYATYKHLDLSLTPFSLLNVTRGIFVIHFESPSKLFSGRATGTHVSCNHKLLKQQFESQVSVQYLKMSCYLEVYASIPIMVKNSENLFHEDSSIAFWQNHCIHLKYFLFA